MTQPMTHLTRIQISMHADKALPAEEALLADQHLATCSNCQARVAAQTAEVRLISTAMQIEPADESWKVATPKFRRPLTLGSFAMANIATGLVIWLAQFLWKTLFGELVVNATSWATSIYLPDIYAMISTTALYLLEEGTAMFDAYLGLIVAALVALTSLSLLFVYRRSERALGACLLVVVTSITLAPAPAQALELRQNKDVVTISSSETIDDTVVAAAETVLIEGTIKGDLVAMGRRVDVTGNVEGNLITFAETVTVSGNVSGLALGGARSYDLLGAKVAGDLWVGANKVRIDNTAQVLRNATLASESSTVDGSVGKDFYALSENVELNGQVGRNLEAFANRVRLLGNAQVGGNLRLRSRNKDSLQQSADSTVGGEIEFLDMPEELEDESRYARGEFYVFQVARLLAAFLFGVLIFWLFPGFRTIVLGSGMDSLKSAGIGFLTTITVPIVLIIVAVTLVGLPLSLLGLAAFMFTVYLAMVVMAMIIGRMLLSESNSWPLALLAGLAIIIVAVNLPFIGGVISFVLFILGMGLIVQYLLKTLPARDATQYG